MKLRNILNAVIRPGEQSGYVAECLEIPVVTQAATLDETAANLREAIELHLEDEEAAALGLVRHPTVIVTLALEPEYA